MHLESTAESSKERGVGKGVAQVRPGLAGVSGLTAYPQGSVLLSLRNLPSPKLTWKPIKDLVVAL